jgi:hypothetical protein
MKAFGGILAESGRGRNRNERLKREPHKPSRKTLKFVVRVFLESERISRFCYKPSKRLM